MVQIKNAARSIERAYKTSVAIPRLALKRDFIFN